MNVSDVCATVYETSTQVNIKTSFQNTVNIET